MKRLPVIFLLVFAASLATAGTFKEIDFKVLKLSPEDYKNDKVVYTATYMQVMTTFHNYMESSGFKNDKYFWLVIGDVTIPVMAKKKDAITAVIANLKRGQTVKVYGKIKKFRREPKQKLHPHYYLEFDNLEVVATARVPGQDQPNQPVRPRPRPLPPGKRPLRRR